MSDRRLNTDIRYTLGVSFPPDMNDPLADALHDLDLADKEIALMDTLYDQSQEALREQASELAAAQATIAERTEDAVVLADKLKFCEMDNYTKDSAIDDLNQRIKGQAQRLTHRDVVIAALELVDAKERIATTAESYTAEIRAAVAPPEEGCR